ncbi:unnamed protein product, partial [Polarella glacialis]
MRRAWTGKDVIEKQRAVMGYLHCLQVMRQQVSQTFYDTELVGLNKQFQLQYMGESLMKVLTSSVPPVDLVHVVGFKTALQRYTATEKDKRDSVASTLADSLRKADWAYIEEVIHADTVTIKGHQAKTAQAVARSDKMNLQYMQKRYADGNMRVQEHMSAQLAYHHLDDLSDAVQVVNAAIQNHRAETSYIIACLDFTIWPSEVLFVEEESAIAALKTLCHQSPLNLGLVMMSQAQSQRLMQPTQVIYSNSFPHSDWKDSSVMRGKIGPAPLIRVKDMRGYDYEQDIDTSRMTAQERTEQRGVPCACEIIKCCLAGMQLTSDNLVVVADIMPNRFAELGAAMYELQKNSFGPDLVYHGFFKNPGQASELRGHMAGHLLENWWETHVDAGPPVRPVSSTENIALPDLKVANWTQGGVAILPTATLLAKFPVGSPYKDQLQTLMDAFKTANPLPIVANAAAGARSTALAMPNFCQNPPADLTKDCDLVSIPVGDVAGELGRSASVADRPVVIITSTGIYITSSSDADMTVEASELFGFNTGHFEMKPVDADSKSCVKWLLNKDSEYVALKTHTGDRKLQS